MISRSPGHPVKSTFEPRIAAFICHKCFNEALVWNSESQPEHIFQLQHICAATVGPTELRQALSDGADGVLVLGCLLEGCMTESGHVKALQVLYENQRLLKELGVAAGRVRQEWITPCDAAKVDEILAEFTAEIRAQGPMPIFGLRRQEERS